MGQKAKIKHEVVRPEMAHCVRAVAKGADEAAHNFVPRAEPDDGEQTLHNVTTIIEDCGIRLHGFTNVHRVDERVSETGYQVSGVTGDALMNYMLAPVKRAFAEHSRVTTYVMVLDKGPFLPVPKVFTQKTRTRALLDTMERQQIDPIVVPADGAVPLMVARDRVLPPWIAVRANRALFRIAVDQLMALILAHYRPPAGHRLIIDTIDMSAVAPATLADWLRSERIECDAYAIEMIERTRAALAHVADWRNHADRITKELAQTGHIRSMPICIETNADGVTYAPFALPAAANQCGEADIGVLYWLDALQADRQHRTLAGQRRVAAPIEPTLARFYDDDATAIAVHNALATVQGPPATPVAERRARAEALLRADPDLVLQHNAAVRTAVADAEPLSAANACREPNRALVLSSDTDFLSLLPLAYAQLVYAHADNPQYCLDNSPLFCIGECRVTRVGWLTSSADYAVAAAGKRKPDDDEEEEASTGLRAHEIYDVHRMYEALVRQYAPAPATAVRQFECVASFALFCASCENDYLAGLYFVNRTHMLAAFKALGGRLVCYDTSVGSALIVPSQYTTYLKHCYYNSLAAARGEKNKPSKPASATTYAEMATLVANKYKGATSGQKHMPDETRRALMYERLQWWLVYAAEAWQTTARMLDYRTWGWRDGTIDVLV